MPAFGQCSRSTRSFRLSFNYIKRKNEAEAVWHRSLFVLCDNNNCIRLHLRLQKRLNSPHDCLSIFLNPEESFCGSCDNRWKRTWPKKCGIPRYTPPFDPQPGTHPPSVSSHVHVLFTQRREQNCSLTARWICVSIEWLRSAVAGIFKIISSMFCFQSCGAWTILASRPPSGSKMHSSS